SSWPPLKIGKKIDAVPPRVGSESVLSTKVLLEIAESEAPSEIRGSFAARASSTRANDAAKRRSAATMSGRRSSRSDGTPVGGGGGIATRSGGSSISAAG